MKFCERLRYLIDCKEMRIKDLAQQLSISPSALSNYAQGTREPDFTTLLRIANYFEVSSDYLLGYCPTSQSADSEESLLALYHCLTPGQKALLLQQAQLIQEFKVETTTKQDDPT